MKSYRIETVKTVLDNVHGVIGLTALEDAIERLPVFKRLHNISQLGLTNRVFPCALHNRYTHSLGVMFIVDQMAVRLSFDDDERQVIRLAAMLHDIGHYPFSHDVEAAYMAHNAMKVSELTLSAFANEARNSLNKKSTSSTELEFFLNGRSNIFHHEEIGTEVIKASSKIKEAIKKYYIHNNEKFSGQDEDEVLNYIINDICAVITGDAQHNSKSFPRSFPIMVQIMHSELDADRIDYLLRDASFSGTSYGTFDVGMLIQSLRKGNDPITGKQIVGVEPKGICCAEQFLINRFFAYNQVIFHKHTAFLGFALQKIVEWMLKDRGSGFADENIHDMVQQHEKDDRFIRFTDARLIEKITNIDPTHVPCREPIISMVNFIKTYQTAEMEKEIISSGTDINRVYDTLKTSPVFSELEATVSSGDCRNAIYRYCEMPLTKHVPKDEFEKILQDNVDNKRIDPDSLNEYRVDRLLDGLSVIEDGEDPYLLIDSPRSMLRDIYKLKYCILRKYKV